MVVVKVKISSSLGVKRVLLLLLLSAFCWLRERLRWWSVSNVSVCVCGMCRWKRTGTSVFHLVSAAATAAAVLSCNHIVCLFCLGLFFSWCRPVPCFLFLFLSLSLSLSLSLFLSHSLLITESVHAFIALQRRWDCRRRNRAWYKKSKKEKVSVKSFFLSQPGQKKVSNKKKKKCNEDDAAT